MRQYLAKKLTEETKELINLYLFFNYDIGLKREFYIKELKQLLFALKSKKRLY